MFKIFKRKCRCAVLRLCEQKGSFAVSEGMPSLVAESAVREDLERQGRRLGFSDEERRYIGVATANCPAGYDCVLDECRILVLLKVLGQYFRELDYRTGEIADGVCSCTNVVRGDVHFLSEVITRQGEHIEIVRLAIKNEELVRFYLYGERNPSKELSANNNCAGIIAQLAAAGVRVRVLCEAIATRIGARKSAWRGLEEMVRRKDGNIDDKIRQALKCGKSESDYAASFEVVIDLES